jgi:FG-GAP-like repeat
MRLPARGRTALPLGLSLTIVTTALVGLAAPAEASQVVQTPYFAAAAAAATAIPAVPRPADPTVGPMVTRRQIVQNALGWLAENVAYSQTNYSPGIADPSTLYRTDCSGFVSMAWETDVRTDANNWNGGYVTWTLPNIATRLPSVMDLQPGDILDNLAHHVILFTGWVDKATGVFSYIAETEPGLNMQPVDSESVIGGTISGYPFNSFVPYTYENVVPSGAASTVTGDWDLNGTVDLLTIGNSTPNSVGSTVSLWQGAGNGRFRYGKPAELRDDFSPYVSITRSIDLTGDRIPDLVAIDQTGQLWLIPGNGTGGFLPPQLAGVGWTGYRILAAGDFTGDGRADLLAIAPDGGLYLYPGTGAGHFTTAVRVGNSWTPMKLVAVGAFAGAGTTDLVATDATGALWLYPWAAKGGFGPRVQIGNGWTGWRVFSPGDFTGDGNPDLVGVDPTGRLWLYPGNPSNGKVGFLPRTLLGNGWNLLTVF